MVEWNIKEKRERKFEEVTNDRFNVRLNSERLLTSLRQEPSPFSPYLFQKNGKIKTKVKLKVCTQ